MTDMAKAMAEVDAELASALRFLMSGTSPDIKVISDGWINLIAEFQKRDHVKMEIGDIRPVSPSLAGEAKIGRKKCFLNTPLVAVLEEIKEDRGERFFHVALVYQGGGSTLAGRGDLIVTSESGAEVMVEAWNPFTMRERDLGPAPFFRLSTGTVEFVRRLADSVLTSTDPVPPLALEIPDAAWKFPAMEAEDPRLIFREREVEVGFILAMRIISSLREFAPVERPHYLRVAASKSWVSPLNTKPRAKLRLVKQ